MSNKPKVKKIGLWTTTSLVIGNMIGSGIFLLPASLASYGGISIFGWVFSAIGAFLLAVIFSRISRTMPKAGGPYAYTREGFGDFAAFLVAWGYWISIWCGNAAITVAFISYMGVFFPVLLTNNLIAISFGLITVWILTWVNTRGVKTAGSIQLVTTILKLIPVLTIAIAGIFFIRLDHFIPFNLSGESFFPAVTATATLTLWAFLGLESATVPADNIEDPQKTIPRATLIGTIITTIVYIMSTFAIMGIIAPQELQNSNAPYADAAMMMFGKSGHYIIAATTAIASFGALNGWILMQGQIPLAAANDRLFPAVFGKRNKKGMPVTGLIISSALISLLIMMNFTKGLVETFRFIILLSTLTVLVPYIFSTAAYAVFVLREKISDRKKLYGRLLLAALAFTFSIWTVAGSGQEIVYWGFILLMAGVPFYVWLRYKNQNT